MSFIENKNLNYLATVEQFFVALKDSGLTLSASDYHLIGQWEEAGIPVNLVCRAIENALADFEKRNPRQADKVSLRYLKIYVDEEIERSRT